MREQDDDDDTGAAPTQKRSREKDEDAADRPLDTQPRAVGGIGRRLLESAGWREGQGLGRQQQGARWQTRTHARGATPTY
jgi:hypothetical protein